MKKIILALLLATVALGTASAQSKQKISNRYSMELVENGDGTYSLKYPNDYKYVNLDEVPELLTVYEHKPIASSKHYKQCVSEEYVYKSYPEYDLKLIVDRGVSDQPTPFVVWIHGGGWSAGNNNAFRISSQYLAVQKGIAGVRIAYSLAGQPNAKIDVTMEDIKDAVKWVQKHAKELNINPKSFGFCGQSAGAHLSAAAAMTIKGTKAMVGYAGPYDFLSENAGVVTRSNNTRKRYFYNLDPDVLWEYSPIYMIPRKNIPATLLFHGTGDRLVDYTQSVEYAEAIKKKGGEVELVVYPYYDHNLHSKRSDKGGEILRRTAEFFAEHLK
ncbi:MAG: alpha/beta hydrolase [Tidjanibacter sp.]|nr:alpha/beta hydrolase [Tidjanibacter sp.]